MPTVKESIQSCIDKTPLSSIVKIMVILAFWVMGGITDSECATFCTQLSYQFDTTAHTISKDANTYTILQMLTNACDNIYPIEQELNPYVMKTILKAAKNKGYITTDNYTTLMAKT